ncbi:MAG TPA: diguanylate cyclase, partial [Rhodospirillales bacterium]|nr:diguanylate cyclase [Rhodospirillales bacterium]
MSAGPSNANEASPVNPNEEVPAPSFGLHDAERIVRRLAPALHAHGVWIQSIHTTLICRSVEGCRKVRRDGHLRSELGHWFADESNEFIRRHPEYERAVRQHREVYGLARVLCNAVETDRPIDPADYAAFADAIARLDRSLEALVKELWDLLRYTDPLTGIATRYAMLPRLHEEHQRVRRTGLTSSVCMVDLDHFKQVNDTWGHHAGDAVLEAVSGYLVHNLRRYDQVCRYGGEEFVLMLPNTEPEQAVPIVDRLRRGLAELRVPVGDRTLQITASFGIAPLLADQPIAASIERADRAMYAAKRAGRDRVRVWSEDDRDGT